MQRKDRGYLWDMASACDEIIAFHCQQCAENYLKALFVHHDRKPPFVHDLLKLNREIQDLHPSLAEVEPECERLTPFGTVT